MATQEIPLTRDARAVALKKLQQIQSSLGTLVALLGHTPATRPLDATLPTTLMQLAEFELADVGRTLGIETDSAAEREQRYVMLRKANLRVRELEAQLGRSVGAEVIQAGIKAMHARIDGWWRLEGFGHINAVDFQMYGCTVNFSCELFGDFALVDSATPVSDKQRKAQWRESLRERGFALVQEGHDWVIEHCDASRNALCEMFARRLPSARILKIDTDHASSVGCSVMRGIEVHIRALADVEALPEKPAR